MFQNRSNEEQVNDVLESLFQRIHKQSQAWLALGGRQELKEDQHVEKRNHDEQITWVEGRIKGRIESNPIR